MNPFETMEEDIFKSPDFAECCLIGGRSVPCVVSAVSTATQYTEFGEDLGTSFFLRIQKRFYTPKKSDIVTYKDTQYRVANFELDSGQIVYNVYLKSMSSK